MNRSRLSTSVLTPFLIGVLSVLLLASLLFSRSPHPSVHAVPGDFHVYYPTVVVYPTVTPSLHMHSLERKNP